jgi:hypothetical protein
MSSTLAWAFRENLCLARSDAHGFHVLYHPAEPRVDEPAMRARYESLARTSPELGFAVIGATTEGTLAGLVGDLWDLRDDEGDLLRADWSLGFSFGGLAASCERLDDPSAWRRSRLAEVPHPSGLDFLFLSADR